MDKKKKMFLLLTLVIILAVFISIGGILLVNRDINTEDASAAVEEDVDATASNEATGPVTVSEMKTQQIGKIVFRSPKFVAKGESITLDFAYQPNLPQPTSTPKPTIYQPTPTFYNGSQPTPAPVQSSSIKWKGIICGESIEADGWYISIPVVMKARDCEVEMSVMNGTKDEGGFAQPLNLYTTVKNFKMDNIAFPKTVSVNSPRFEISNKFVETEIAKLPITKTGDVSFKWTWEALSPSCSLIYATQANGYKDGTAVLRADQKGTCIVSLTVTAFSCENCIVKQKIAAKSKKIIKIKIDGSAVIPTLTVVPSTVKLTPTPTKPNVSPTHFQPTPTKPYPTSKPTFTPVPTSNSNVVKPTTFILP